VATVELLGVYGLSDYEKQAEYLYNITLDPALQAAGWAKITSLGATQWNSNIIKKMQDNYSLLKARGISGSTAAANIALQTGVNQNTAQAFVDMQSGGTAPRGLISSVGNAISAPVSAVNDTIKYMAIAAAAVAGVILLIQFKGVKSVTQKA
jgi:hypothetical protein